MSKNRDTDNTLVGPTDFDPFCITAPTNAQLPDGGGYPVCGMYDVKQERFGQRQDLVALAWNYGDPVYRNHFVNFTMDARLPGGARFGGGVDTGWSLRDTCYVVDSPQELLYCHVVTPFKANTQLKFNGSYPMKWGLILAGTYQNLAGPTYDANYPATSAEVAPSLKRPLAGGTRSVSVPLVAPNTLFESRTTRLDLRLSKIITFGATRLQLNLDAYNALNSSSILAVNSTYDARWRQPNSVIDPRLFQVSGQISF